jgi:hypothetical protein
MTVSKISSLGTDELVALFESLALRQHTANQEGDTPAYNKIYFRLKEIGDEFRSRSGDQRRVLLHLLSHKTAWVRYMAAINTLVVAPVEARGVINELAVKSNNEFATAYARRTVNALERGTFPLK